MIEVDHHLFVGNQIDYETKVKGKPGWSVVHACKEPYHREAVGYTGRSLDRGHSEYLLAYRDVDGAQFTRLALNMIDAPKMDFFRDEMIDAALAFMHLAVTGRRDTLVHCNQGGSRSPSLVLLYLRRYTDHFDDMTFEEAEDVFRAMYPLYLPAAGIRAYVAANWR
jgi:hypothetical protein